MKNKTVEKQYRLIQKSTEKAVSPFTKKLTGTDDQEIFEFGWGFIRELTIRGTKYTLIRGNKPKTYKKDYWCVCFCVIDENLNHKEMIEITFIPTETTNFKAIELIKVHSANKGNGVGLLSHGTNVLKYICDLADKTKTEIFGAIECLESDGLSDEKLFKWYGLFNFFKNAPKENKYSVVRIPNLKVKDVDILEKI